MCVWLKSIVSVGSAYSWKQLRIVSPESKDSNAMELNHKHDPGFNILFN